MEQCSARVSSGHLSVPGVPAVIVGNTDRTARVDELASIMAWGTRTLAHGGRV